MLYIQNSKAILQAIDTLATHRILWVDTEIAHWDTAYPKLSLIQVLSDPKDRSGEKAYLLDVFNQPQLIREFINKIMMNPMIEKVFHNAAFDLKYLGEKQAQNVTCTYNISKKISLDILGTPNRKLKTLASFLCGFQNVDTEEQSSDWGQRPLTAKQLAYASMDTVYLAHVHHRLLAIINAEETNPLFFFMSLK